MTAISAVVRSVARLEAEVLAGPGFVDRCLEAARQLEIYAERLEFSNLPKVAVVRCPRSEFYGLLSEMRGAVYPGPNHSRGFVVAGFRFVPDPSLPDYGPNETPRVLVVVVLEDRVDPVLIPTTSAPQP